MVELFNDSKVKIKRRKQQNFDREVLVISIIKNLQLRIKSCLGL